MFGMRLIDVNLQLYGIQEEEFSKNQNAQPSALFTEEEDEVEHIEHVVDEPDIPPRMRGKWPKKHYKPREYRRGYRPR